MFMSLWYESYTEITFNNIDQATQHFNMQINSWLPQINELALSQTNRICVMD